MKMDWNDYKRRFAAEAGGKGHSERFISECLAYAEPLMRAGLPIIYDNEHFASLLGFEEGALKSALQNNSTLYHNFNIPKRKTGYRTISKPNPFLREIQYWILRHILNNCDYHPAATAFVRARSIKLNAELHRCQPIVLSLDVQDFFPSITASRIRDVYKKLGYSSDVAEALMLSTTLRDGLPQGAPTSPALSNLVMRDVDESLSLYAANSGILYTRYADDLTFSGNFHTGDVIRAARASLGKIGLALNEDKTRQMLPHQRQEVTGVVVNAKVQAPRELRRDLRMQLYYIKRLGPDEHLKRRFSLYSRQIEHLRGIAEFILFLNPSDRDAREAVEHLGRVMYERRMKLK